MFEIIEPKGALLITFIVIDKLEHADVAIGKILLHLGNQPVEILLQPSWGFPIEAQTILETDISGLQFRLRVAEKFFLRVALPDTNRAERIFPVPVEDRNGNGRRQSEIVIVKLPWRSNVPPSENEGAASDLCNFKLASERNTCDSEAFRSGRWFKEDSSRSSITG